MKIYLDCTETFRSAHNTGIQRVVRNIVNESLKLALPLGVECQAVINHGGRYRIIAGIENPAANRKEPRLCDTKWYRAGAEAACRAVPAKALRNWILPEHGHKGIFYLPRSIGRSVRRFCYRYLPEALPAKGDCLISLDLSLKRDWSHFERLRDEGVKLGGVIYDLEPIFHPEFFSERMCGRFEKWVKDAAQHYDFMLSISETVRSQLIDYLRDQRIFTHLNPSRIAAFRLGANLDGAARSATQDSKVRQEVVHEFVGSHAPTFLTVGTIEPRKNHKLLLDAMEQAWDAGAEVRCCIVGMIGWKCEELVERIQSHPELGRRLLVYHDLTDEELQFVYRHCDAFVYPTHAEGFGLPLVEAMRMGLPVIASDLPILRETSGGYAKFIRNTTPDDLTEHLIRIAAGRERLMAPPPDRIPAITWADSARHFMEQAMTQAPGEQGRAPVRHAIAA